MQMKQLQLYSTSLVHQKIEFSKLQMLSEILKILFFAFPYDMFVIEDVKDYAVVRLSGYSFETSLLDETSEILNLPFTIKEKLWFKIDDYGDKFVGTLLFPEEW